MAFKRLALALLLTFAAAFAVSSAARAEPLRIVGFGDSLMAGYGLDAGQSFPEKLQAALQNKGHDVVIDNAGVSGDTSSGGLARLDWSVPDGTGLVILELGANDMLRGIAPDITRRNLDAMIAALRKRNIGVVLAGMRAAPNLGPDFAASFDPIYPDLAAKYEVPLYPFFLDGVAAQRDLQLEDGMHPNGKGIDVMVDRFLPTIEAELARMGGGA
ncbi:MAG: arylesterase [Rhizobiaceae bacterium]|nr:arylesterase [Rhizobiaceae bacterium]